MFTYDMPNGSKKPYKTLTGFKKFLLKMNPVATDVQWEGDKFYWTKGDTKLFIPEARVK